MIPAPQWASAWSDFPSTTEQQARLAEADLDRWLAGAPHASFDPFRNLLTPILPHFQTFLEVGSGWGGYCKVLHHIDHWKLYYGCDISKHMVDYAKTKWHGYKFKLCGSESLSYGNEEMGVVCLSGLIQHLADYRPSIKEAARVSKRYVLLHRVEATSGQDHEFIRRAYDSDVPTRKVNEGTLLLFCGLTGLVLRQRETWSGDGANWSGSYLFEKTP